MSLLNTVSKKVLTAGKYAFNLISYREVTNDKGGYIELTLELPDRFIKQNLFPENKAENKRGTLNYFMGAIKRQMKVEDKEMELVDILELAKSQKKDALFCVISYSDDYGMNVAFHEKQSVSTEVGFEDAK